MILNDKFLFMFSGYYLLHLYLTLSFGKIQYRMFSYFNQTNMIIIRGFYEYNLLSDYL